VADAVESTAVQAAGLEGDVAAAVAAVRSRLAGGLAAARGLVEEAQVSWYHVFINDQTRCTDLGDVLPSVRLRPASELHVPLHSISRIRYCAY
jgi:hypothetical protein